MLAVYLDTNCINARKENPFLNELEELHQQEKILIEKTDTLDTELQEGNGYPLGAKKSLDYIESFGAAAVNHSRVGFSVVGSRQDEEKLNKILTILFGQKPRNHYLRKQIRDAMHIATAERYGGNFFVTTDKQLLAKTSEIEQEFGLKIRNPQECLQEVKERLQRGY